MHPGKRVGNRRGRRRYRAERDALRAVTLGELAQRDGGAIEGFAPRDPLPAGVGIALGPRPLQRIEETVAMVDELGRRATLGAQRLTGGMRRIGLERDEPPVLHDRDRAAA